MSPQSPAPSSGPEPILAHRTHPFSPTMVQEAHAKGVEKQQRHISSGMSYADICAERRAEYRAHLAAMDQASKDVLEAFGAKLARRTGTQLTRVHFQVLPWAVAFMVQRYGEEVAHWPPSLTDADQKRITQMTKALSELGNIEPLPIVNGVVLTPEGVTLYGLKEALTGGAQ